MAYCQVVWGKGKGHVQVYSFPHRNPNTPTKADNCAVFHPYKQRVRKCSNNLFTPLYVYTCLCITWGVKYASLWSRNLGLLKSKALKGMKILF